MNMNTNAIIKNFTPSKVDAGEVALTFSGQIAIRRKNGDYVSVVDGEVRNEMSMVTDISKYTYLVPTQTPAVGDVVKSKDKYYYITAVTDKELKVINMSTGTRSTLTAEHNIICGKTPYQKVTTMLNGFGGNTAATQNGFNPMMLAMLGDGDTDLTKLMLMQGMTGTNFFGAPATATNPQTTTDDVQN